MCEINQNLVELLSKSIGRSNAEFQKILEKISRQQKVMEQFSKYRRMSGNKLDIDVKFKIKSMESSPLDETKQQYKNAKEAAKQLGLDFEEE